MEFETPKTDWKPESVPEPKDFNRIEKNIAHLNEAVTIGPVKSAQCDENGKNIASTYLGTSRTPLTEKDVPISYMTELSLKDSIDKYKYLIFLIRGGATPESKFYYSTMIERSLFVELSNANYPFVIDGKTIRLMFSYLSSKQKILTIYTSTLGYLTVYGLN